MRSGWSNGMRPNVWTVFSLRLLVQKKGGGGDGIFSRPDLDRLWSRLVGLFVTPEALGGAIFEHRFHRGWSRFHDAIPRCRTKISPASARCTRRSTPPRTGWTSATSGSCAWTPSRPCGLSGASPWRETSSQKVRCGVVRQAGTPKSSWSYAKIALRFLIRPPEGPSPNQRAAECV